MRGNENDPDEMDTREVVKIADALLADTMIRAAICYCWGLMPHDHRTADLVAAHIDRIVDRALKDFADDAISFGLVE